MRILFVHEKCGYFGGVEQNVADSAALRRRGHEIHLLYGERTAREADAYAALFESAAPCRALGAAAGVALDEAVARLRPDVVYLHKAPRVAPVLDAAAAVGARAVRMVHDHDLCCPRRHKYFFLSGRTCDRPAGWRCWLDGAFLARRADAPLGIATLPLGEHLGEMGRNHRLDGIVVASEYMRRELVQNGFPQERIRVLAPAVRPVAADAEAEPSPGPVILFVGQLIRGKGVDLLLRAAARLRGVWRLEVVGDGNARAGLESMCRRVGLSERVRFHGWIGPVAIGRRYAQARVVAVPSRWPEPFGMVGLEAMAHARPVVAFAVGGIPDWLEHETTGLLVAEQDVDGLAAALQRLLDDASLASMLGRRGRARVAEQFSFDRYLDALEAFLAGG